MKKILSILITLICCSSCDLLIVEPENSVTYTNYFTTEQELEAVIYEMMGSMRDYLFDYQNHVCMGTLADETSSYYAGLRELSPSSVNGISCSWSSFYSIIYDANILLDNLFRATKVPADRIDFYRGQACFGKGVSYFFIARSWGEAVITKDSKTFTAYGKSPVLEVIDTVISNALTAYKLLPEYENLKSYTGSDITSKQFGSKGAAAALLAHAYAWKGSMIEVLDLQGDAAACYEQSIHYATEIIEGHTGTYSLLAPESYCQAVSKPRTPNPESIFEIEIDEMSSYVRYHGIASSYVTWPVNRDNTETSITYKDFRIFNTTVDKMYSATDLRKKAYFYTPENPVQTTYAYPYKFREGYYKTEYGYTSYQSLYANNVYWRLADIYLLRAECYAKTNNPLAKEDLNVIRRNAQAAEYPAAGDTDIQLAVFREREKELLFEDHRYYDVVRNGKKYIRTELSEAFSRLTDQDIKDGALFLPITDGAFTLNDKMRQNIYWGRVIN